MRPDLDGSDLDTSRHVHIHADVRVAPIVPQRQ